MSDFLRFLAGVVVDLLRGRGVLVAENALLRQQLIVAERKPVGRVRWAPWQRFTMGVAARIAPTWRSCTLLVQPATILRWHRAGFRVFWRRRSRPEGRHLRRLMAEYVRFYNGARPHQAQQQPVCAR